MEQSLRCIKGEEEAHPWASIVECALIAQYDILNWLDSTYHFASMQSLVTENSCKIVQILYFFSVYFSHFSQTVIIYLYVYMPTRDNSRYNLSFWILIRYIIVNLY